MPRLPKPRPHERGVPGLRRAVLPQGANAAFGLPCELAIGLGRVARLVDPQLERIFARMWDVHDGLILVDEPLAALDPGLQFDLLDSLQRFCAARGHAVVAILHDINHALLGFERLLLVRSGQLVADIASDAGAVPALAALYGIALTTATSSDGDVCVIPARSAARRAA